MQRKPQAKRPRSKPEWGLLPYGVRCPGTVAAVVDSISKTPVSTDVAVLTYEREIMTTEVAAAFLAAYGVPMLATPNAVRRRLLYDLYLFVIMVVEVSYRHYPTDDIERFGHTHLALTLDELGIAHR
jgi:hypothetical protein